VSCEDDHDHNEEHTDAEGFILETSSGTEMYREFKGTQTGSVTLNAGDTLELSVHFLDDNGKEMEHDEHEGEEEEEGELKVSGFNSSVALVEVEEEHDDHGDEEEHEMGLEIIGVSIGSTSFKLELMHDGHADYTSTNNIPIIVK
jgi:activator of 2-hydroxyglutaryl-CoA dehydratase